MDFAVAVPREERFVHQKAPDFRLRLQPPGGVVLQRFANDGGQRLIRHQHLAAMARHTRVAISQGRPETPIAVAGARLHPVLGLLGVLLALMLGHGGEKILHQHAVGIFAELDGRRFQLSASGADRGAELDVRFKPARKAADVVDDDDVRFSAAVLFEEGEHRHHAGSIDDAAGRSLVPKHFDHVIALGARVVAAACLLRAKARSARHLLGV
ncbi:MAG: hypothetical protein WC026_14300 [Hyphomicrobium sp.]